MLMDFSSCPCSGANLPRYLYPAILGVLAEAPRHGYLILKAVSDNGFFRNNPPDQTGLYRALSRMEGDGLLQSGLTGGDVQKKVYSLTQRGVHCLEEWIKTLTEHSVCLTEFIGFLHERAEQCREGREECRGE